MANLGEGIASLGKMGDAFYQKELQQQEYDAERRFQEFQWTKQQELVERQRTAPTGAEGFTEAWRQDYHKGAAEFLASVPEQFKAKYDAKLFATDRSLSDTAQQFQFGEQSRASKVQNQESLNGVYVPKAGSVSTEQVETVFKEYERQVRLDTRLSTKEQDEAIAEGRKQIVLGHIDKLPPEQKVAALEAAGGGSFDAKLRWRESKNRPSAQNSLGYSGLYQFGAPRVADLGIYTPGAGENVSDRAAKGGWSGQKWTGEFNIPGFPQVKTIKDFLGNADAQEAVYNLHKLRMDREIEQNGFDRFIGQSVRGIPITKEGLYGMMHLGGVQGTKNALERGIVAQDDNKTSVLDYARMGTGATPSIMGVALTREQHNQLINSARVELNAERVAREHQQVLEQKERKRIEDEAENKWVTQALTPGVNVSISEMAKDPALGPEAKQKLFGFLERVGRMDKTATTYGSEFYSLFQRVHAAEGDPNRITDPTVLYDYVRENGGLTLAGMEKLRGEMSGKRTPEGAAESELRKQFFANAKSQISGSNEGLGLKDPKGDELFLKFMAQAMAEYDRGKKDGKSPSAMLNPDSADYIGKSITNYKRPMAQWFSDAVADKPAAAPAKFDPLAVNSLDDLKRAHIAGYVTALEARAIAVQRGWAKERAPAVAPAEMPRVPLSQ